MNGDDIKWQNESMPYFPPEMKWWQRILCLLGYHKRETRQTAKGHRWFPTKEEPFGVLHDDRPMKLRDQCGRCGTLLNPEPEAE